MEDFQGAKIALFLGTQLLVYQRDDKATIPFPGYWDLPGGVREGNENAMECVSERVQSLYVGALERNREEFEPMGRSLHSCARKPQREEITRFRSTPSGQCLCGRSTVLRILAIARLLLRYRAL
jgi:8-oxo-dGTP diphosphatase